MSACDNVIGLFTMSGGLKLKYFLVWEAYDREWKLKEKGSHFLAIDDPENIDIEALDFCGRLAEAKNIDPLYLVLVNCNRVS
ncbi:hypothetical protein ACNKCJ_003594 [Cronobacter dublinensis]